MMVLSIKLNGAAIAKTVSHLSLKPPKTSTFPADETSFSTFPTFVPSLPWKTFGILVALQNGKTRRFHTRRVVLGAGIIPVNSIACERKRLCFPILSGACLGKSIVSIEYKTAPKRRRFSPTRVCAAVEVGIEDEVCPELLCLWYDAQYTTRLAGVQQRLPVPRIEHALPHDTTALSFHSCAQLALVLRIAQ
jgi:hypothetical protein